MAGAKGVDNIKQNEDGTEESVEERQARIDRRDAQKIEDEAMKIRKEKFMQLPKQEDKQESSKGARSKILEKEKDEEESNPGSESSEEREATLKTWYYGMKKEEFDNIIAKSVETTKSTVDYELEGIREEMRKMDIKNKNAIKALSKTPEIKKVKQEDDTDEEDCLSIDSEEETELKEKSGKLPRSEVGASASSGRKPSHTTTQIKSTGSTDCLFLAQANITLKNPEVFTGTMSSKLTVKQFLRDYELYIQTAFQGSEDRSKQFLLPNLNNLAADWYHEEILPFESSLKWSEIKKKFTKRFENSHGEQQLVDQIYVKVQEKGQSVSSYSEELHALMTNTSMKEDAKILFFVKGLRNGIKRLVTRRKPLTYQKAIKFALDAEAKIKACTTDAEHETTAYNTKRQSRDLVALTQRAEQVSGTSFAPRATQVFSRDPRDFTRNTTCYSERPDTQRIYTNQRGGMRYASSSNAGNRNQSFNNRNMNSYNQQWYPRNFQRQFVDRMPGNERRFGGYGRSESRQQTPYFDNRRSFNQNQGRSSFNNNNSSNNNYQYVQRGNVRDGRYIRPQLNNGLGFQQK